MDINFIFTCSAAFLSALLVINYIVLVKKYNKDKMLPIKTTSEEELLKKYGAVISACIIQKRGASSKDIIAIIVSLIQRNIISISSKRITKNGTIINSYTLKYVKKDEALDDFEKEVVDILFREDDVCNLNIALEKHEKFNIIKESINKKLKLLGVNGLKVPKKNQIINTVFFVFVCIFFILHIVYNFDKSISFSDIFSNFNYWAIMIIKIDSLLILLVTFIKIFSMIMERLKTKNNFYKIVFTDKLIINIFLNFILSNVIVLLFLVFIPSNIYFVFDIFLFDISMVVMVTDELLVSHSPRMNKDYISLKKFESTLKEGGIFEFFTPDSAVKLEKCIPLVIALDEKDINIVEYMKKMVEISLDENEIKKYKILRDLVKFKEPEIRKFYYNN